MTPKPPLPEPSNVLSRIKRGLSGYVSYLAACEMNVSFTEYMLYEPILRILTARAYSVQCEVECPGIQQPAKGDKKRLDFVATWPGGATFALEVKWAKKRNLDVSTDYEKLLAYSTCDDNSRAFLCVFGRASVVEGLVKLQNFAEEGRIVTADFGITKYSCRIFELAVTKQRVNQSGAPR